MGLAASLLREKHNGVLISVVQLFTELCKANKDAMEYLRKNCIKGDTYITEKEKTAGNHKNSFTKKTLFREIEKIPSVFNPEKDLSIHIAVI
uniref:Uncharacterized protein n=4 Tax=Aegilops tauschii subsp. strangulata TaxID=200361 RepID=A0A453EYV5_AEGTS